MSKKQQSLGRALRRKNKVFNLNPHTGNYELFNRSKRNNAQLEWIIPGDTTSPDPLKPIQQ
jgi:hypothetical protein